MMPTLNLLPWRQWRRQRRNRLFMLQLAAALAVALLLVGAAGWRLQSAVGSQANRNALLQERMAALNGRISLAERLRQRRDALLAQIDAMQSLEAQRTAIKRIFDVLANSLPGAVHYQAVALKGDLLALTGAADSSAAVAALMRRLEASAAFAETRLIGIEAAEDGAASKVFHLTAVRQPPRNQGQSTASAAQQSGRSGVASPKPGGPHERPSPPNSGGGSPNAGLGVRSSRLQKP